MAILDGDAVARRHSPVVRSVDRFAPLSVGNGRFAFTVDATGLQTLADYYGERSGAGLTYEDDADLEQCLRFIAEAPEAAAELAVPGRRYVLDNYTWPVTLDRMEAGLKEMAGLA